MDALSSQYFSPTSLPELFYFWERFPTAVPFAGGTELLRDQGGIKLHLPVNTLALSQIEELRRISRTERYLEIGSMVTLNGLLALGKQLPVILRLALSNAANPQIRNLATIGGNICAQSRRMDSFAPLALLDARLELRTATTSRWVATGRFATAPGAPLRENNELLTRIRIPIETWDYVTYRRLGQRHYITEDAAVFSFIAKNQKGILSDIRMALAGSTWYRDRQLENLLVGKALPLSHREVSEYVEKWRNRLELCEYPSGLLRDQFLNLIEYSIGNLSV